MCVLYKLRLFVESHTDGMQH